MSSADRMESAEAANPNTSAGRLEVLAGRSRRLAALVAVNPSASPETLLRLGERHLQQLLLNPALPRLLENSSFTLRLPKAALWMVLNDPEATPAQLHILAKHPDQSISTAARWHRGLAQESASLPGDAPDWPLLKAVEKGSRTVFEAVRVGAAPAWIIQAALESGSRQLREAAWASAQREPEGPAFAHAQLLVHLGAKPGLASFGRAKKGVTPEQLTALAKGGPFARVLVAKYAWTPPETLKALLEDAATSAVTRQRVLRHPQLPSTMIREIAFSGAPKARATLARRKDLAPDLLELLATDDSAEVRAAVAFNRRLSGTMAESLAADDEVKVRRGAAGHPGLAPAIQELLAEDPDREVRLAVAGNPSAAPDVLQKIATTDKDWTIRRAAVENSRLGGNPHKNALLYLDPRRKKPGSEEPTVEEMVRAEQLGRAQAAKDSPEQLEEMVDDPSVEVRQFVAQCPMTPSEALRTLSADDEPSVRFAALANPNVPVDLLERFTLYPDEEVQAVVATNRSTPPDCLEQLSLVLKGADLARLVHNRSTPRELLDRLARTETDERVRQALLSEATPLLPETIRYLYQSGAKKPAEWLLDARVPEGLLVEIIGQVLACAPRIQLLQTNCFRRERANPYWPAPSPLSAEVLTALMEFPGDLASRHRMIAAIADYPDTPASVLEESMDWLYLRPAPEATPANVKALTAIAKAAQCPPSILERLAVSHWPTVRLAALRHPACPTSALDQRRIALQEEVGRSTGSAQRLYALALPGIAQTQLRARAWQGSWSERLAIALNPACPRDILAYLGEDAHLQVQAAARKQYIARFPDGFFCHSPAPQAGQNTAESNS